LSETSKSLTELRDKPFELLQELERRISQAASGRGGAQASAADEWVGVAYQLGEFQFVTDRREIREILMLPSVTRVPGAKSWVRGLANIRGQLLPIIDLNAFFGGEESITGRATRILWVNHADIPTGLVVDSVKGFRRFTNSEATDEVQAFDAAYRPFVKGGYRHDELWNVFDLVALVESQVFLTASDTTGAVTT